MLPTIERAPRRSIYSSAMRYPAAGELPEPRLRAELEPAHLPAALAADFFSAAAARTGAGFPAASRSATRVSARSTLTSTCFFNVNQSFDVWTGRAPSVGVLAARAARKSDQCSVRGARAPPGRRALRLYRA